MREIAVSRMDLDDLEPCFTRASRGHRIQLQRPRNRFSVERRRHLIAVAECERRRRDQWPCAVLLAKRLSALPRTADRAFAARVIELDRRRRAVRFDDARDARIRVTLHVVPEAEAMRSNE